VRNEPGGEAGGRRRSSSGLVFSSRRRRRDHADMAADLHRGLKAMHRADAGEVSAASHCDRVSRHDSTAICV
jgi:hypothetical protein